MAGCRRTGPRRAGSSCSRACAALKQLRRWLDYRATRGARQSGRRLAPFASARGQGGEPGRRERLGACARVDAGADLDPGVSSALQQRCAASCVAARRRPPRPARRRAARAQMAARPAARARTKVDWTRGGGRKAPGPMSNSGSTRSHGASITVSRRSRRSGPRHADPTTSFCSMKCMSADRVALLDQPEQQRRRDVVRQVADEPQPRRRERRRSNSSASASCTRRSPWPRTAVAQMADGVAIDLDGVELAGRRAEQRAVIAPRPGPISTSRSPGADRSPHDPLDHAGVVQEVLAEALFRATCITSPPARGASELDGQRRRRREAAGSAVPVPASVERRAVIDRRADDRQAEGHVHRVPKPAYLITGRPWSWYIASTASACGACAAVNAVSAGTGP